MVILVERSLVLYGRKERGGENRSCDKEIKEMLVGKKNSVYVNDIMIF